MWWQNSALEIDTFRVFEFAPRLPAAYRRKTMLRFSGKRRGLAAIGTVLAVGITAVVLPSAIARAEDLPNCPEVWVHGGFPGSDWRSDKVRQPQNPKALRHYGGLGVTGAEVDIQLSKNGTKAFMWHNGSTYKLTGSNDPVNTLWWGDGENKLNDRTIEEGPFKGERLYSLRQYLDAAKSQGITPMIEIKSPAEQSLLNSDAAIRTRAWSEVLDPIAERTGDQEIMLYTHSDTLKSELNSRILDAGLDEIIPVSPDKPVWPDVLPWTEPAQSYLGNVDSWTAALAKEPRRMATSWPAEMRAWLQGRCS